MANNGKAFVVGGIGCFVVFCVLALLALLFGGSAHLDPGGILILFIIGGVVGLVVNWIYQKGRGDACDDESDDEYDD